MQNSTPTVKAKTCRSTNQQTKVLCQKMAFYIADSAVSRQPTLRFMSASAKCRLASEPHALPTVQCCHTALRNVVADYSSDMHTAQHLQHTNTFTVATGADIERRPTGDPPHSTRFLFLTAVQFGCTGTHLIAKGAVHCLI